jgi:hypothetical protein
MNIYIILFSSINEKYHLWSVLYQNIDRTTRKIKFRYIVCISKTKSGYDPVPRSVRRCWSSSISHVSSYYTRLSSEAYSQSVSLSGRLCPLPSVQNTLNGRYSWHCMETYVTKWTPEIHVYFNSTSSTVELYSVQTNLETIRTICCERCVKNIQILFTEMFRENRT